MELSGKHDKGGSHEELCRGHPAGMLRQLCSMYSMYNDMYIYYASHIICIGLFRHLFSPIMASFLVPSDSGDHPDLRRSVRPGPEAGQLLHRGLQRRRGS